MEIGHDSCGVGFVARISGESGPDILPLALTALARLGHRGGVNADGKTGDGAGVLTAIPHAVLDPYLRQQGIAVPRHDLAVGVLFLPARNAGATGRPIVTQALSRAGLAVLGFREVPVRRDVLGDLARRACPAIVQVFTRRPLGLSDESFERRLFEARRRAEGEARRAGLPDFHFASFSHRTVVYKALVRASELGDFYADLGDSGYETPFTVFHQRFSTNTAPAWNLVQPFRVLAHNGEINTIQGNRAWMRAREGNIDASRLGVASDCLRDLLTPGGSDSAHLDEALELLARGGRSLPHGITLLMPPAWEHDPRRPASHRAFFEYQSCLIEPWDGPACVAFADGRFVGAALDRNGLRPARYRVTRSGVVVVASEAGVLDVPEGDTVERGRLGPGGLVAVDLDAGRWLDGDAIIEDLASQRPYAAWLDEKLVRGIPGPIEEAEAPAAMTARLAAFGYTREQRQFILGPMFREGREPVGSMGDDAPLAVLSSRPPPLLAFFRQRFAQVTNPPIDPIREACVLSSRVILGPRRDILTETPAHARQIHLEGPLLTPAQVAHLESAVVSRQTLLFDAAGGPAAFEARMATLVEESKRAVDEGATLLVLSDEGVDEERAAVPSLLAVSAVHQSLLRSGRRCQVGIVVVTGQARDDHEVAALVAFGAEAVCPLLALAAIREMVQRDGGGRADERAAEARYLTALERGVMKILSKMGISTLRSYHGAQLFEAVGLSAELLAAHFGIEPTLAGNVDLAALAATTLARHASAFASHRTDLDEGSRHRFRRGGEVHAFEPSVVKALHAAMASQKPLDYQTYARLVHARGPIALRDLLEFRRESEVRGRKVEPARAIVQRFSTAAMSLGALSPEAQAVLTKAMGRLGARSNSGEGGEGAAANRIKQVASGRFGVTTAYLVGADELQIKMAQGSKPGEGGQLPGHKVTAEIARVRHATPGVPLISPPPHHDIYSIEDLAELIYDLKQLSPGVVVSVKLASGAGIGTIAAGVVKAHADVIVVAGHDGGTGASPLGSIANAGTPWEIGLSDVQQTLARSGLRDRVRLRVEGGLRTGRDVVMAALLGADEFAFGTAALVAAGCVMARQCHLNTCPAGIATQREDLRRRFHGTAEDVGRFVTAVAEEVREILRLLGHARLGDVVGCTELLAAAEPHRGRRVDLGSLLAGVPRSAARRYGGRRNPPPVTGLRLEKGLLRALRRGNASGPLTLRARISNQDRAVGAAVAGELTRRRASGRPCAPAIRMRFHGSAGQGFGSFCVEGMSLSLEGEANDFVGRGMTGGEIALRPFAGALRAKPVIAGNAVLYGATGGSLFAAGIVGDRFAVRNSGAVAVVEGAGEHACEYMTGGVALILGPFGRNLAAGMTSGAVYVLDPAGRLPSLCNPEHVAVRGALAPSEVEWIHQLLRRHVVATGSAYGIELTGRFDDLVGALFRVAPHGHSTDQILAALPRWERVGVPVEPAARTAIAV